MANLQGGNIGIDMFSGFSGPIITTSSDLIQVSYGGGRVANYWGSFQYTGTTLTGGTINVYEEVIAGVRSYAVTDLTASATSVFNQIAANDTVGVLNLLFGGSDSLVGSTAADTLVGLGGIDFITGGEGNDDVNGNVSSDVLTGGSGADWVRGGQGNDTVLGGAGDDPHVNGNLGNDSVYGESGNDTLYGGQGDDSVEGGTGDDLLAGDLGAFDILFGGSGADRFYLHSNSQLDIVADFNAAEGDRVALPIGATYRVQASATGNATIVIPGVGWENWLILDGVTPGQFQSSWVVYI